ncbi:hypothetical protein MMC10_004546 [Thelotrema lepadinum]|nr:hypothetical protein [Thelotrema lepadinum]
MKASVGKGYSADIKADVAKGFPADMKANVAKGYPADIKASFTVAKGYPADIQNSVLLDMPMGLGMAPAPQKGLSRARYFLRNLRNRRNRKDNNPPKSPDPSQKHLGPRAVQSKEGPDDSPSSTSHPLSKSLPPPFFYSPSGFYSPPGHPSFVWPRLIPGPVNRPKGPQQFHHMVRPRPFIHGPFFPPEQSHYRKQVFGASDYPIRPLLEPGPFPKHGPLPPRPKNVFAPPPGFGHSLPLVPPSGLQQPGSDRRSSTSQNTKAPPSPSTPEHDSPAYGAERGRKRRKYEK